MELIVSKNSNKKNIELVDPEADLKALATGNAELIKIESLVKDTENSFIEESKKALIIGATGFLGGNFISSLISSPHYSDIYCFVRDKKGKSGLERIRENMKKYQCDDYSNLDKIKCISSTYTEELFGLTEEQYNNLAEEIDVVFHFASNTDYRLQYQDFRDKFVLKNIDILNFCVTGKRKQVHYVCSTIALLYRNLQDFQQPNCWWYSGYSKMKWVNRKLYLEAFKNGVRGGIYLPPYIVGRTGLGVDPAYTYSYWRIILEMMRIKLIWDDEFFQTIPVNILCKIILDNSLSDNPRNETVTTLPTIHTREIADILNCKIVPWEEFKEVGSKKFRQSQQITIEDLGPLFFGKVNLEIKGIDNKLVENFPSYIDTFKSGLSQPKMKLWCKRLNVQPQI